MNPALTADPDRWRRIEILLDQALDLPPDERDALLDTACADDPGLRAEVESLLAADADAGAFLGMPIGEYAPELLAEASGVEEDEEDLAGRQLGPYRLLREVGGGGMGTVYEAEDVRLGRRVAVKLPPPEVSRDRRAKERFLREARVASAVDHPNLCTVYDVGESDGRLYIVLAFYEGETLRDRLRRGPLPLAEAREVALQVARGLARAHEAGIVHRDIKPANVMLPRRGEAKILDFGIARLEGDPASITRTGGSWGTPAYMSPEQARGDSVDARTDVWSLGVLIYEMVAGRRPFGGESLEAVVSAILTREPESLERVRPEDVPPELARVVERSLAKNPSERYSNAVELLSDLETGRAPSRRRSRRKALWPVFIAGALAVLSLLGLALWRPWQAMARPPLRVALLQPVVQSAGDHPDLAFIASDVLDAALTALVSLDGVQPLDPPEKNEEKGAEAERLHEAQEALLPVLDCRDDTCQVIFRRRKPDGVVVAVSEAFEVQGGFENAYQLAEGVRVHVQQVYDDHRLRPESAGRSVQPADYSEYVELQHRIDRGERLDKADLDRLDALLRTSPGLVGAHVLAADTARDEGDLDRAFAYAARAVEVAPYDPRPLLARFRVEMELNRLQDAGATLERLAELAPADARVQNARANLLAARGELEEARRLREEVARRRPTWRHIVELATMEVRLGLGREARQRLEDLLAAQPENRYVRENLAGQETLYGDPRQAAKLYEELIRGQPALPHLRTNLGFARYLLGDYSGAAAAHQEAFALAPDNLMIRFNLATALEALGDRAGAQGHYRTIATELAAAPPASLDEHIRMLHAQCLVRLGQRAAAERVVGEVLKHARPENLQILHQAAQVHALLGEHLAALFYAEQALKKGLGRAWFTIPEFRSLRNDPDFQRLLDRYAARRR